MPLADGPDHQRHQEPERELKVARRLRARTHTPRPARARRLPHPSSQKAPRHPLPQHPHHTRALGGDAEIPDGRKTIWRRYDSSERWYSIRQGSRAMATSAPHSTRHSSWPSASALAGWWGSQPHGTPMQMRCWPISERLAAPLLVGRGDRTMRSSTSGSRGYLRQVGTCAANSTTMPSGPYRTQARSRAIGARYPAAAEPACTRRCERRRRT